MKCENPSCNKNAIKQYKSSWCCSVHCALALAAMHSHQKYKENYNGHHKCSKCNCEFRTKAELQKHKIDVHYGTETFKCICGKEFHSKHSLGSHKQQCTEYLKQTGKLLDHYICSGCQKEFKSRASLQSHIAHCDKYVKNSPSGLHTSKYWNEDKQKYTCECGKEFKNHQSLNAHFSMCKTHKVAIGKEPRIAESKIRCGEKCSFHKGYMPKEKYDAMHEKSRQTIADNIKNNVRTYRFNFDNRVKQGWYKGFYCDSSYELAFVIYCLEHNIPITKCRQVFKYEYNGKIRRYYPDFEINGVIYEIKGYECELSKLKHKLFPEIKMLYKADLQKCFDYVIQKYGKNFTELYEK